MSDPVCHAIGEEAICQLSKLDTTGPFVVQDIRADASNAGLPSDGLSDEGTVFCSEVACQIFRAKSHPKCRKPSKYSVSIRQNVSTCVRTRVTWSVPRRLTSLMMMKPA